jgi:phosphoribosylanthranilate isomerase
VATLLKVCCIASIEEAELAVAHGASAIGLVSAMPSGPGVVDDEIIREVAAWARGRARSFLLTSRTDPAAIAEQVHDLRPDTVQLVDALPEGAHATLRRLAPTVRIVQVIHVRSPADVDDALRLAPVVDELLLDSGNPALAVKELGGTGRTHDWALSARIVRESAVPVWLAGGLRAENAAAAIATVRPHGLDVCSGVRRDGRLNEVRLEGLVAALTTPP